MVVYDGNVMQKHFDYIHIFHIYLRAFQEERVSSLMLLKSVNDKY